MRNYFIVFLAALGVLAFSNTALADACGDALSAAGMSGGCQDTTCSSSQASTLVIGGALTDAQALQVQLSCMCGSGMYACAKVTPEDLCKRVGSLLGQPSACISSCVSGKNKQASSMVSRPVQDNCGGGSCCVSTDGTPVVEGGKVGTASCIDNSQLAVSAVCKASATDDEMDTTKYSSLAKYTQGGKTIGCPSGQVCVVKKGSELCSAYAKLLSLPSYNCIASCATGQELKSKTGDLGETCPGGQVCCVATAAAAAAKKVTPTSYTLTNPLGPVTSIPVIIGKIIKMFLGIVGALALLVFVYGGVAWMTARGDAGQVKHAQQAIQGAVLGLIIISGSYLFADSFIKALTEMQVTNIAGTDGGAGGAESTQATTEQTTLEQQQAAAAAAAKAKAGTKGAVCVGDQTAAKACQGDCKQFCLNQAKDANVGEAGHPCTNLGQSGCPTDQVCCSWKK